MHEPALLFQISIKVVKDENVLRLLQKNVPKIKTESPDNDQNKD